MTKILIDEAVVDSIDRLIESARLLGATQAKQGFGVYTQEDSVMERSFYESVHKHKSVIRQALANAALDKMADNARELGLSYEQPAPAQPDHIEDVLAMVEQPAPAQPLTDEQIQKCYETSGHCQTLRPQDRFAVFALARAIEAAHGITKGGV